MAAGVTDRLWDVNDLVALWEAYEQRRAERAAQMRWFRITQAEIKHETRELLEQYGPDTLRALLPGKRHPRTYKWSTGDDR
jgi:hypothetical protein